MNAHKSLERYIPAQTDLLSSEKKSVLDEKDIRITYFFFI